MSWRLEREDDGNYFELTHVQLDMELDTEKGEIAAIYRVELHGRLELVQEWTCRRTLFKERDLENARSLAKGAARPFGLEVIDLTKEMEG